VEYAIAATERPNRLPDAIFTRLKRHFTEAQIVELTLRVTLCGFFNKFNDALQIEEEPEAIDRVAALAE
jgi:alkylhydroperoxidase family enzyme